MAQLEDDTLGQITMKLAGFTELAVFRGAHELPALRFLAVKSDDDDDYLQGVSDRAVDSQPFTELVQITGTD